MRGREWYIKLLQSVYIRVKVTYPENDFIYSLASSASTTNAPPKRIAGSSML